MHNLTDIGYVRAALEAHGIKLSKGLGQNFLVNPSVCPRMAQMSGADEKTGVIEIGPGIGVLTVELAKVAAKVVAIELDERLRPLLRAHLEPYPNAEVIFGDAMKIDLAALIKEKFAGLERVIVCANLPYYITSPIIMMLLENALPIDSITVLVQREAAERMCAEVGSRLSGAVTVAVRRASDPQILFRVSPGSFTPPPKVESAVMRLDILSDVPEDEGGVFSALVRAGFSQRRKTFINSASSTGRFSKQQLSKALELADISQTVRIEQLTLDQLYQLADILRKES